MDLTFQVPMKYCSLQHQTLLSPPDIPTAGHGLSLFIVSIAISLLFPSSVLDTFQRGEFIFWYHTFLPFHPLHKVLTASILKRLPFLPPVDHVLSAPSTMTCLSWVVLDGMAHSFIGLCKSLSHDKAVILEGDLLITAC